MTTDLVRRPALRVSGVALAVLLFFTLRGFAEIPVEAPVQQPAANPPTPRSGPARPRIAVPPPTRRGAKPDAVQVAGPDTDVIKFRNGDMLHGTLVAVALPAGLRWLTPEAPAAIEFATKNVVQVQLAARAGADQPPPRARIQLTNDDQLRGDIVSLNDEKLVIDTWYAGSLELPRTMVRRLTPQAGNGTALYAGPTGLEGWRRSREDGGWSYKNGAFYSSGSGSIGRDLKLPDRARVEFELAWRNFPYCQLALYTDNLEALYGNCYMLQFGGNSVYLQRGRSNNFNNLGGGTTLDNLPQRTKTRVSLLLDKPKRTIVLLLDGVMVKQWVDPGEFAGGGTGLLFQSQGQGPLRISNLTVTEWDGELDANPTLNAAKEDVVRFVNNDKVSGQLKAISKDTITFVTSYATLEIPLARAVQIEFNAEKAEKARRQSADIQASFAGGGRVTLALEKLDEQSLTGASENFGRHTFARGAFQQIRFHIYDESAEPAEEDDWGM